MVHIHRVTSYTKWLIETNSDDIALTGGKASSLGQMMNNLSKLGVKIPNGFVVTTVGFDKFMEYNNLTETINGIISKTDGSNIVESNIIELKRDSLKIRNLIINGVFPDDMKEEILLKYISLSNMYLDSHGNPQEATDVAVRSSGTCEDLSDASFAGTNDSYLNIRCNSNLLEKIKCCFASLYNDRAISYRKSTKYDNNKIKLAVCVQKMVRSDLGASGVAFSIETESSCKNIILINAILGLGELIVSGDAIPDEFLVFKPTLEQGYDAIIDKKLGNKTHKMVYSDDSDKRTKIIHVDDKKKNSFCLDNAQILQLAKWVLDIEKFYSEFKGYYAPVDCEFAVDGITNEIYIVQARFETCYLNKNGAELCECIMEKNQEKKILLSGIAVGDKITTGKCKLIYSLDTREQEINFNSGDILVAETTDPTYVHLMKRASGVITQRGSRTSHSAIVCRELQIPCIVGVENCMRILKNEQEVTINCSEGNVGYIYDGYLNYRLLKTNVDDLPKIKTNIMLNLADPGSAFNLAKLPVTGIGLLRAEFIISNFIKIHPNALLNYDKIDSELKNQVDILMSGFISPIDYYIKKLIYGIARIASAFYPKPVIYRFSDFKSNEYADLLGGRSYEPIEENPMIGWRGCSRYYDLKFKEAFGLECQAIKYIREKLGLYNVIVMLPFCRTVMECKRVLEVMKENGLERGVCGLQVYIMCEIPANVILAEEFCKLVDGFSIGSNDLTQLVLGVDRDSELISHIYDERNEAVKMMISQAIKICKKNKVKIGICGQGPSTFIDFAEFLVREGIDSLSLTPDSVIKTIKSIYNLENRLVEVPFHS